MRPAPSAQTASICGSCLGSSEPESFAMLLVCQSIWPPSPYDRENHAIFATRSPTAIKNILPFRLRRKQIPDTSRSGTWTTRRTRRRLFFGLPFLAMGEGSLRGIRLPELFRKTDSTMLGARSSWTQVQCPLWIQSRHSRREKAALIFCSLAALSLMISCRRARTVASQNRCPLWVRAGLAGGLAKRKYSCLLRIYLGNPGLILTSPSNFGLRNLADAGIVNDERVATSPGSGDRLCWCLSRPRYCGGRAGGRCKAKPDQD